MDKVQKGTTQDPIISQAINFRNRDFSICLQKILSITHQELVKNISMQVVLNDNNNQMILIIKNHGVSLKMLKDTSEFVIIQTGYSPN